MFPVTPNNSLKSLRALNKQFIILVPCLKTGKQRDEEHPGPTAFQVQDVFTAAQACRKNLSM